jgi:signal transduction histidine kinase/ActR/RegA family two-component response regulator
MKIMSPGGFGLRERLMVLLVITVSAVVLVLSGVFVYSLRSNLNEALASKTAVMQEALRRKGLAIASNVALTSGRAMAVRNFSFLGEVLHTAIKQDEDFVYGILMDTEGRALIHTDPSRANAVLSAPEDAFAQAQTEPAAHFVRYNGEEVLEMVAPVIAAEQRWGTVRFGMTQRNLLQEIHQSERDGALQISRALLISLVSAVVLMAFGTLGGAAYSLKIVQPLVRLMAGAVRIREGDLDTPVVVQGSREFLELANTFNDMALAVKQRETALADALHAAEQAIRLKGEFLANVSHELRTPLNAIINVPRALSKDYQTQLAWHCDGCGKFYGLDADSQASNEASPEPCPSCGGILTLQTRAMFKGNATQHYQFLQRMLQAAQHLLGVVTDVLDFSKLEAGKARLTLGSMEVARILENVVDTVQPLAQAKRLDLRRGNVPAALLIRADEVKVSQILINLLGNAIKFTDESGRVTLRVEPRDGEYLAFIVEDNGIGIQADKLEVIFESFRQADGGHTRAYGGTGLGLTIARSFAEMHEGKLWAESEFGKGSRFTLLLPVAGPKGAGAQDEPATVEDGQQLKGHIVVVDDDQTQLELLEHLLTGAGFDVDAVSSSLAAVERVKRGGIDLVIVDIMMPEMSGLSVLSALKADARTAPIPIIVSSAYHANRDLAESQGGIWLPKPWSQGDLLQCVKAQTAPNAKAKA